MSNERSRESQREAQRIAEQAAAWYLDLHDTPDAALHAQFFDWLQRSPRHVAEYLAIAQLHDDLHGAASMETLDAAALAALAARESAVVPLRQEPAVLRPAAATVSVAATRERRRTRRIAAWAGIGAAAMFALIFISIRFDTPTTTPVRYASGDDIRDVGLPDGTLIQLDRNSLIAVRYDAHQRNIELVQGGALFDVGKDSTRPLRVTLGKDTLRDIGTVFAVHRAQDGTSVTVLSGQVSLLGPLPRWRTLWIQLSGQMVDDSAPPLAQLRRGDEAFVDTEGSLIRQPAQVPISRATAWLPRDIRFRNATVGEVARRFNAYTTHPLVIEDPNVASIRISGVFHGSDPDAFVTYLATLPGVAVERSADAVHIGERAVPMAAPVRRR